MELALPSLHGLTRLSWNQLSLGDGEPHLAPCWTAWQQLLVLEVWSGGVVRDCSRTGAVRSDALRGRGGPRSV